MNTNQYCIIMAGGIGSRFWPISRQGRPKQFIDVLGVGRTFLQMTYDRYAAIVPPENILVVTAERYRDLVFEQLPGIPVGNVLLEPYKRNTAPCVAYATYKLFNRNPEATVIVAPADHLILDEAAFADTIRTALDYASASDHLFTIGIHPTRPETNYGYIQISKGHERQVGEHDLFAVKTFTEKPNAELARVFIETGEFFWNSGMFIWNLRTIKSELEKCLPEVATLFQGGEPYWDREGEKEFIRRVYEDCPAISIDYGVMEKTRKAWVFLSKFGWSDLGTWEAVYEQSPSRDGAGNIIKCEVPMVDDVKDSIITSRNPGKLVVARGFDNMMVVDLKDVLLVCRRDDRTVADIVTDLTMKDKVDRYL